MTQPGSDHLLTLHPLTLFAGLSVLARGSRAEVAQALASAIRARRNEVLLAFDDHTGQVVDLDWRGSDAEIAARYTHSAPDDSHTAATQLPRGPGRPRLGVTAREVTLLPAHWEWLATQRGGASVTLRRLVDEARRASATADRARASRDAAYRFLHAIAGDLPGFEEVSRALFADDRARMTQLMADWPRDVCDYAWRLLDA
ncbi:MAG TPA: DUF2239 family protein [Gemmatimonas sp.]|uniref:DUF2239 family protein n=1 Tax=Gemmatimonas sp. TaxID=1962908 RepID=UPI002ED7B99C